MIPRTSFFVLLFFISMALFYSCALFWQITVDVYKDGPVTGTEDRMICYDSFDVNDTTYYKYISTFKKKTYKLGCYFLRIRALGEIPLYILIDRVQFSFPGGTKTDLLNNKRINIHLYTSSVVKPMFIDINGRKALKIPDDYRDDSGKITIYFDNVLIPDMSEFYVDLSMTLFYETGEEKILHLQSRFNKMKEVRYTFPST